MPYIPCPECHGEGKIPTEVKTSRDTAVVGEIKCELCDGEGFLYEDATPAILEAINGTNERLDRMIEVLTKNSGGKKNGSIESG